MASASDGLFERLAAIPPASPDPSWRELLAAGAFAEPATLSRALGKGRDRNSIALLLAAQLAEQTAAGGELDDHFMQALQPFWFAVATVNLTDWQFWHSPRQPLRRVLHQLLLLGRGYSPSAHPATVQFPQRLQIRLQAMAEHAVAGVGSAQLLQSLKSLYALLRQTHELQRQSDHRLLEQEELNRRSLNAQTQVSRVIRQAVWGQPVPASVVSFLDETWRKYLYLLHLRGGMQDPVWQRAVTDIRLMVWLGSEASPQQLGDAVKGELPGLLRRIREALALTRTEPSAQNFPEVFAALLAARARNVPDAGLPLGELPDEPDDALAEPSNSRTDHLPARGSCLLLKRGEDDWLRVRVIAAPPQRDYLLLADFAGSRVAALSPAEWQQAMQEDRLRRLSDQDPVQQLLPRLPTLLQPLLEGAAEERARRKALAEQQEREAAVEAKRRREADREAAFELRKQQEASERAERIAEGRRRAKAEALLAQQQAKGRAIIASLRGGALVELRREEGQFRACYLAMIRASDQHYIFVDRQGRKVAELNHDALLQQLLEDGLRVIESGSALDNTLQNLVSERRQFLSDEDGS